MPQRQQQVRLKSIIRQRTLTRHSKDADRLKTAANVDMREGPNYMDIPIQILVLEFTFSKKTSPMNARSRLSKDYLYIQISVQSLKQTHEIPNQIYK